MSDGRFGAAARREDGEFQAGFTNWHEGVAAAITRAFTGNAGFEANDPRERAMGGVRARPFASFDTDADANSDWNPQESAPGHADHAEFIDPVTAAQAAGYAEGFAAGLAKAADDTGRDQALVDAIGAALSGDDRFDRDRVARQLRQTVMMLVTRLVGESGVSGELLGARVTTAVDMIGDGIESAVLRLNPQDMALVEGKLPATLHPIADATVVRGGFQLESASTIVEDNPEAWLEQLTQAIDRVGVPE